MPGPSMTKQHPYDVFTSDDSKRSVSGKRVVLIVNPASGGKKGLKILEQVKPILEKGGCNVTVVYTEYAGHAKDLAKDMDLTEVDVFCPIGGDGTVHETCNGYLLRADYEQVKDRVAIGIIPGGTGNTLAYDLHVNSPEKACELIIKGDARAIDCGKVEALADLGSGEYAVDTSQPPVYSINMIGYGLPTTVLVKANSWRWLGGAQYKLAAYHSLLRHRAYACKIEVIKADDSKEVIEGTYAMIQGQVTVHMGDRMAFVPTAKLDDGLLDLMLIKYGGRLALVDTLTSAEKTKHMDKRNLTHISCKSFSVIPTAKGKKALAGPKTVNIDGELAAYTPYRCTVLPSSVICIAGSSK